MGPAVPFSIDQVVVGRSPRMRAVFDYVRVVADPDGTPLIGGETGPGKDLSATPRPQPSHRRNKPFVPVSCAIFAETLIESELFGHERGAFTGAIKDRPGRFEAAEGGTIFLDDVDDVPMSVQVKLLRVLQNRVIERLGGSRAIPVDVRTVTGTKRDLRQMVHEGKFREDLLWRLNGKKLVLPSLRERVSDIAELVTHFLARERPRRNKTVDSEALEALNAHSWPGNVRELRRVCDQLSLYAPLPVIRREDVLKVLPATGRSRSVGADIDLAKGLNQVIAEFEAEVIRMALARNNDIDQTANLLQISRSSLYKKIKDYNIEIRS